MDNANYIFMSFASLPSYLRELLGTGDKRIVDKQLNYFQWWPFSLLKACKWFEKITSIESLKPAKIIIQTPRSKQRKKESESVKFKKKKN